MLDASGDTKTSQAPGRPSPKDLVWKTGTCISNFNMKQTARDAGESEAAQALSASEREI